MIALGKLFNTISCSQRSVVLIVNTIGENKINGCGI